MKSQKAATYLPISIVCLAAASLWAQSGINRSILLAIGANVKQVVQYQWKQRVTVIRKSNPAEPIIDQVRFDSNGNLERTTISAPTPKEMRGIRGKVAANVKENVKSIMELAGEYNKPQRIVEAVRKAEIIPASSRDVLQLQAASLIQPSDSMTMFVNSTTHLSTHLDIRTAYDGGPMTISQDYSALPAGPNVMKSMIVSVPHDGLVVKVESFDFQHQTASLDRR